MNEKKDVVRLTDEEKKRWDDWKEKATEELLPIALSMPPEKIEYFIRTGITRALDQRHGTAAKKLAAVESGRIPDLFDLIPKGSEKQQLIRKLLPKLPQFTKEMLNQMKVDHLRKLLETL